MLDTITSQQNSAATYPCIGHDSHVCAEHFAVHM